jgi:hypothetical protein
MAAPLVYMGYVSQSHADACPGPGCTVCAPEALKPVQTTAPLCCTNGDVAVVVYEN